MNARIVLLALFVALNVQAEPLPQVSPELVGFANERLEKITAFTGREVSEGRLAGAVTLVARHGKVVHFEAVGRYGVDNDKPLDKDALFRIYSMTKPVTTVAMMMLYEEGHYQLADPVAKYLPEFGHQQVLVDGELRDVQSPMTIEQLMSHTAGLSYGFPADHPGRAAFEAADVSGSKNLVEFTERLAKVPLQFEPGRRYYYSYATDVLGALVEHFSGMTLEEYFAQRIFAPLGMHDTFFNVPEDKLSRVVSNHYWDRQNDVLAALPAERARPLTGVTLYSGGAGLVSTAMDYMIFCEMLRNGGSYSGARILGPKTVQYMTMDHLTPEVRDEGAAENPASHLYPGHSFGLGFSVITHPGQAQVISSKGAYSWGGAANTKFWIDPEEDMVAILMSQVLGTPWSDYTRYHMKIATYQALSELHSE